MTEQETNLAVADGLMEGYVRGGDFDDVPMADDLRFRGPLASADSGEDYRAICRAFADAVRGIEVRTRVAADDVVHLVYDVDMSLPDGPLPTSQTIRFEDGRIVDVVVIFDAYRITGAAS